MRNDSQSGWIQILGPDLNCSLLIGVCLLLTTPPHSQSSTEDVTTAHHSLRECRHHTDKILSF